MSKKTQAQNGATDRCLSPPAIGLAAIDRVETAVVRTADYLIRIGSHADEAVRRSRAIVARAVDAESADAVSLGFAATGPATTAGSLERLALMLAAQEHAAKTESELVVVPHELRRPMRPAQPNRLVPALRRESYALAADLVAGAVSGKVTTS